MTRVMIKQDATNIEMPAHVVLTLMPYGTSCDPTCIVTKTDEPTPD